VVRRASSGLVDWSAELILLLVAAAVEAAFWAAVAIAALIAAAVEALRAE
jgi:hypothetical protein